MAIFPLIRRISGNVTPVLARLPATPNAITAVSLAAGMACAWCMLQGDRRSSIIGAVLLVVSYILDNCDGEIARLKGMCTDFGRHFDDVADELVHAVFFVALGIGTYRATGDAVWAWLGGAAAGGGVINYAVVFLLGKRRDREQGATEAGAPSAPGVGAAPPRGWKQHLAFFLRELARADFCFIVLILAIFDLAWVLLPAAAVGAQVYWMLRFVPGAGNYHV